MGDRAIVVFHDENTVSPMVYLHWFGETVPEYLAMLKDRMVGRFNDASYAAARFIGMYHERIDGNCSLGVFSSDLDHANVNDAAKLEKYSHGDAGLVVVDTKDFTWKAYHGYLAKTDTGET